MICPYCQNRITKVLDKRDSDFLKNKTRRRRECLKCKKRFTTYERVEGLELMVVKKDGRRELFDINKLLKGIQKACEKRPISGDEMNNMANTIELELRNYDSTEIKSTIIGNLVMDKLKSIDPVAYIRFASVYREFADVASFENEFKQLK
ncbi:transcriptional regulator NrdR [Candidatus Woesearchaeota archaeon]|nr:transcriptional regulator NrdR [Candidatus Woesearchaeota archaeon]